jgi:hypothetical protein
VFTCAGASRPTITRPVGRQFFLDLNNLKILPGLEKSDKQHANYGQTVTDHYLSGGVWTAGFRALPETV